MLPVCLLSLDASSKGRNSSQAGGESLFGSTMALKESSSDASGSVVSTTRASASFSHAVLAVVRFSQLNKLAPVLGPRVHFSLLRKLGLATDEACLKHGGRRLRMLHDGVLLGFGVDRLNAAKVTSSLQSAMQAMQEVLRRLVRMQVESGTSVSPHAVIHIVAADRVQMLFCCSANV